MASGMREAVLGGCILHAVSTSLRVLQPDSPQCTRRNQERPRARSLFREGTFWRRHGVGGCGTGAQSKEENILSACSSVLELWDLLGGSLGKVV